MSHYRNNFNRGQKPLRGTERRPNYEFFQRVETDYASEAEKVIIGIKDNLPTTSSIRNILALINNVSMKVANCSENALPQEIKDDISYLKVRIAYTYGRGLRDRKLAATVNFIDKSNLLELLLCVDTKQKYETFAKYVEALIAYHKYYGGKD